MEIMEIYSKGEYPANVLSNFYANRFTFDGVECASMEGFLQSLKYKNPVKQAKVCGLTGKAAKAAGKRKLLWKLTGNLYWNGKRYKRNSREFDELRRRAYVALLENDEFRAALLCAKGKTLTHPIGNKNKRKTVLTELEFISYLNELAAMIDG